jgi:DNA-binding CsgD family transcriptional regulator
MATLSGLLTAVSGGRGNWVLVEGEPGIGKSALVRASIAIAPDSGCQVFWGAGDELSQALPLLPFLDGLKVREPGANPRRNAIVKLLRGDVTADRDIDVQAVLAEQLLALVAEQCATMPTILVIDDLQWADQASIALWARLARSVRQMPLLLIGMMRPIPQREHLLALRRTAGGGTRLELPGLTAASVTELVAALAGGRPDGSLRELIDGAAGNPLYITELIAALDRSCGLTITQAGTAELAGETAPDSLPAAIADRLDFVSGPVREVLQVAALLGVNIEIPDLATVLGRTALDLIAAITEACGLGVLAESGNGLRFRHPLIRDALYEEIPLPMRAAWHREASRALAQAGAPPDRVARQLLPGFGESGDAAEPLGEWILTWLTRAADPLITQAPEVAAELLTRATASTPAGSARHGWLAGRLADALYRTGDAAGAEQIANRALEGATEPDLLVDLHWTLAQCRSRAGLFAESVTTLKRALASPGISAPHRARLLAMAARTHSNYGQVEEAGKLAADALAAASQAGDSWAMSWALLVMAMVTGMQGRTADALPVFDRALTVTRDDPGLTDLRLLLQINKAAALGNLDNHEEALTLAGQARHLADQAGTAIRPAQAHSTLGQLLFHIGRWDEALTEVQVLPENLKEPVAACTDLGIAAVIGFHRGDAAAARRHLAAAVPHATRLGRRLIAPLVLARSLDREHDGAPPQALAALSGAVGGDIDDVEETARLLPDAVRLALLTGDVSTANSLTVRAAELAAGSQIRHWRANALYCCGLLDLDACMLLQAAQWYDEAGRPLPRAQALEAAAAQFVADGDRDRARTAFTNAVEVYSSLDAAADVTRLQAAFRAHGIRRGPRQKHRRARSGWDSLTPTETKIASMVEEGLSNPEIAARLYLSRGTVATHVSHILKKLDMRSRTDIARESARRNHTIT